MLLKGMRVDSKITSLDDIFNHDDLGLLADVKPITAKADADAMVLQTFGEVESFFRRHGRLPNKDGNLDEKILDRKWQALLNNKQHCETLRQYDTLNLLRPSEKTECCKAENVVTLEDIFNNDDLNLLDVGNTDIFRIEHIQQRTINGAPYTDEDNAVRQPCTDFWRFEAWFKQIHHMLKHGKAHFERLKTETFLQPGDVFLLHGALCYVADFAETEDRKSTRGNRRLRVIYENGTESNILTRSLARAVYKDENGKKVMLADTEALPDILTAHNQPDLVTGHLYIVKLLQPKPQLAAYKNLYKIGFTTDTVENRIANAESDTAFLESKVVPVLSFECRNINPHTFERLLHAFFAAQKLNIRLIGKDGKSYIPNEWFDVGLDVIEKAAEYIVNGTINQYRMDNTTGKIVQKLMK
ncbi:GIY-YIG nuclease family protein [Neisseria subflava]|uniref:GIY-YIG nuclease family protein n=1 Tax=Neisseria subflava TaxID=28449 RepID=UPI0020B666C5|nr:GIY-YIG nuclease family protein [Neisseria subflava]UTG73215.1 GIY-YIG nuclease family protein [Neisseria subflava]